jgi:hypothetical protein
MPAGHSLTKRNTMLYKFKSKAAGDVIMLEASGRRILDIIGKEPSPQGIILPEQMPAAISALQKAIAQEAVDQKAQNKPAEDEGENHPQASDAVSLKQRAKPFLDMLERCLRARAEIVWGV